jgi:CDP-glycerol glycerophosphotransferase
VKRIGNDIANPWVSTEHGLRLLLQEVDRWDHLVSPSPFCSQVFRKAFGYDGEILEVGRPGNDVLVGPDAARLRAEMRAALGVPEHHQVLLYAPTWRDNARRGKCWQKVLHLDHELVTAARPDVTVLLRGHPETSSRPEVRGGDRVVDVTSYPDFGRLMLAADVLVTDYSSAMVDFALTDRPVVLLAPDLESYRDRVRGFYVDLPTIAPGPVVRSTREVLDVLPGEGARDLTDGDRWAEARRQLRAEFAPLDDGHAADRVLTALGCL